MKTTQQLGYLALVVVLATSLFAAKGKDKAPEAPFQTNYVADDGGEQVKIFRFTSRESIENAATAINKWLAEITRDHVIVDRLQSYHPHADGEPVLTISLFYRKKVLR